MTKADITDRKEEHVRLISLKFLNNATENQKFAHIVLN